MDQTSEALATKINELVESIRKTTSFWSNHNGWAPEATANILSRAQLNWISSLSVSLHNWNRCLSNGDLILAWANIGAIVEGYLKFFLVVYDHDYRKRPHLRKGDYVSQDVIRLEDLRVYFKKNVWADTDNWDDWISDIQTKRNAIHAFKERDIGDTRQLHDQIFRLHEFVRDIDSRLPYP